MSDLRISPAEAFALMRDQGYTYLDVRSPTEFGLGHPEGAKNIPWQMDPTPGTPANPNFVNEVEAAFSRDAKLIVGCHTNRRSLLASAALQAAGFTNVLEQRAGMAGARDPFGGLIEPGWEACGLPVSRD